MAEPKTEKQDHYTLLQFLNENIPNGTDMFNDLRLRSEEYLSPRDILQSQTMSAIIDKLINKGVCAIGDYIVLRKLVNEVTNNKVILDAIDRAQKEKREFIIVGLHNIRNIQSVNQYVHLHIGHCCRVRPR